MSRADVQRAVAAGGQVSLNGADLSGVDLSDLVAPGVDLSYADLTGARLDRADLRGARLWSVRARGASLVGCDLRAADLQTADLADADLRGARLAGAALTGTTLTGAQLDGAELAPDQLVGAVLGGPLDRTARRPPVSERAGSSGGPSRVSLGEDDDGADVELAVGGVLEVTLPEGTTGYRWQLIAEPESSLTADESHRESALDDAPGAFGRRTFRFTAAASGAAAVRLRLVQPWDPDAPPARTYTARVRVG